MDFFNFHYFDGDMHQIMKTLFGDFDIFVEKGPPKISGTYNGISAEDMTYSRLYYSPKQNGIGMHLSPFLSTFISRTKSFCEALVDVELIQKALHKFSTGCLVKPRLTQCVIAPATMKNGMVEERACHAYFLAAVSIGILQSGRFKKGMQKRCYRKMIEALKPCWDEEHTDIIFAHTAIAYFCFATAQIHEYGRHSGYSNVLLSCCSTSIPENLEQAHSYVVVSHNMAMFFTAHTDVLMTYIKVLLISEQGSACFPRLMRYVETSRKENGQRLDKDHIIALEGLMKTGGNMAISCLFLSTQEYFRSVVTDRRLQKEERSASLWEIINLNKLAQRVFRCENKNLSPSNQGHVFLLEAFYYLAACDCMAAIRTLKAAVEAADTYQLCALFAFPILEHQVHFMIAAMAYLKMGKEYKIFQQKVNSALLLLGRTLFCPSSFEEFYVSDNALLCGDPECTTLWNVIPSLFPKQEKNCVHMQDLQPYACIS